MQNNLRKNRLVLICSLAIVLLSGMIARQKSAMGDDYSAPGPNDPRRPRELPTYEGIEDFEFHPGPNGTAIRVPTQSTPGATAPDKYWLGVMSRKVPPELQTQFGLKADEGLVVSSVAVDSPASKAGIKQYDVIVSAGETKLKRPSDLLKAVNSTDGKELSLKIFRGGKEQIVVVTPTERPQGNLSNTYFAPGPPGFLLPGSGGPPELPDDVSVTIVQQGKQPGKITVSRGDEKWDISHREFDKLPDDLRQQVGRIVGGGPLPFTMRGFEMPGMRIEGLPNGDFHPFPPGFNPPPRDGGGPPRDGQQGPPPHGGPEGPGGFGGPMMMPGQIPPELMERLERLDRRLEMLQAEIGRMQDGQGDGPPRMRPHGPGNGPDGPPSRDDEHDGRPPRDGRRPGPPPGMGGGPPPRDGDGNGPPGRGFREPPPND